MARFKYKTEARRLALIEQHVTQGGKVLVEEQEHINGTFLIFENTERPDSPEVEFKRLPLGKLTPAKVNAYIDTNVTDLASAKTVLKQLAQMVLLLAKKQGI